MAEDLSSMGATQCHPHLPQVTCICKGPLVLIKATADLHLLKKSCWLVQAAAEEIAQRPEEPCSNFAKSFADCMSYNNGGHIG